MPFKKTHFSILFKFIHEKLAVAILLPIKSQKDGSPIELGGLSTQQENEQY